ncbi:hypothetical protein [Psychrobacter sp. Sarcosine-3u-12]|uniref:hypothetical protein n=1 Tax=Psychrobacter sp. Sarcosine-3u-12 TaxID=2058325 RepID=UPI000C346EFA|nr:hypothetical protein [Psychrobacter sp. Sarcosine-3u-12]PKG34163.1 hypothetical protein CXF65_14370 [Psychrobacter sp. Sarcosine-3u-12]
MSKNEILKKLVLNQSNNGNYFAEFEHNGEPCQVHFAKSKVTSDHFYTPLITGISYWASVNLVDGKGYVNHLLPLSKHQHQSSEMQYYCHCKLLENGCVKLSHKVSENEGNRDITLPKSMISNFEYRIFHNSQVIVTFGHNNNGFFIKDWQTKYPNNIDKGDLTSIIKKSPHPKAPYIARYKVEDTYLPVEIWSSLLEKEGICNVNEEARISATLTVDDQQKKANISLTLDHQALMNKYNQPKAKLTFIGIKDTGKSELYQFETTLIDGISLLVTVFSYELKFMNKGIGSFQAGQSVSVCLTYQIKDKWCNFKVPVASKNDYNEQFRCITMTSVDNEGMALLETIKPPHDRVLLPTSELIKHGIYKIHSEVIFGLHITREALDKPWKEKLWHIECINSNFFVGLENGVSYKSECTIIESWSRYDNRPEYVVDLDRYDKNKYKEDIYAFHNHCAAKISNQYADLLVIIPKSLLVRSGFKALSSEVKLNIAFKSIKFPMFGTKAATFLCADRLYSSVELTHGADESRYVLAEFYEKLGSNGSKEKYRFSIVGSEDTVDFTDWSSQLSGIPDLDKYRYKIRIKQNKQYINVKELISASIR